MRAPKVDLLTPYELSTLQGDMVSLIQDAQTAMTITYRHYVEGTYDPGTGTSDGTPVDDTVIASRSIVTVEMAAASSGTLQVGDRQFLIVRGDLTSVPSDGDTIIEADGTELRVDRWDVDPISDCYLLVARSA